MAVEVTKKFTGQIMEEKIENFFENSGQIVRVKDPRCIPHPKTKKPSKGTWPWDYMVCELATPLKIGLGFCISAFFLHFCFFFWHEF